MIKERRKIKKVRRVRNQQKEIYKKERTRIKYSDGWLMRESERKKKTKIEKVRQKEADKKEKVTKKDVLNHKERLRQVSGSYQNYQGPNF